MLSAASFEFMSENFLDNKPFLQLPFHRLETSSDGVKITKNKAILNRKFLFVVLLVALIYFILWTPLKKSSNAFQKPLGLNGWLAITGIALFIGVTMYLSFKRFKRLISDFRITKQGDDLYINNEPVPLPANGEKLMVVIQDVAGSDGVGGSYTVGIAGKNFWGLCYELDKVDAVKAAKYLSDNLSLTIKEREAAAFPLFKLH